MSRPLRIQFEGAAYHVTARGNERKEIFRGDDDRRQFLTTLEDATSRFGLLIHAYCLMPNHYHLLAETPRGNLSRSIGWLQATYTTRFNRRHRRSGHLMQGRFKAQLVESDRSHGLVRPLIRYIHLNPVRPKDRRKAVPIERQGFFEEYPWSSHRAYAGTSASPAWLSTAWLSHWQERAGLSAGITRLRRAYRADLSACFGEVIQSPWSALRAGLVLGGEELWEKAKRLLGASSGKEELALARRDSADQVRVRVARLASLEPDKRLWIWMRVTLGGEQMTALAREFGYNDGSGVLQVVKRLEAHARKDKALQRRLNALRGG